MDATGANLAGVVFMNELLKVRKVRDDAKAIRDHQHCLVRPGRDTNTMRPVE